MTTELMKLNAVSTVASNGISEDLIRKSLIDAIAIIHTAKHGGKGWFDIIQAGQYILIHADRRLNQELTALLMGTYPEYIANPR